MIRWRRRAKAAASVLAVAAAVTLGVAAPAQAAGPQVLVSADGVTFTPNVTVGLFDDVGILVPQDVETRSIWVRLLSP